MTALVLGLANHANAAMPGRLSQNPVAAEAEAPVPPASAIQALPRQPGVIDCLLQRRLPDDSGFGARADIHINYPAFGNRRIDQDIRDWVAGLAEAFAAHSALDSPANEDPQLDALLEALLAEDQPLSESRGIFELWGGYHVSRPSSAAISIAFELWNYTGDPEGNLDIITLNYSLLTGQRLNLVDIFEKPDVALELMSSWARKELETRLGASRRARMLADGTAPVADNFSSITLTPEGICINFQPWQVAPRDAGIQKVAMPLEKLLPAAPLLALWGRGENEQAGID
ncbi:MAG: DUF3298 domain-containing protein [Desulfovibrio sp.]|nr:DUF3298 domain-containing protein [Desulfovibrio sp.]